MIPVLVPRRSEPWRDVLWSFVRDCWLAAGFEPIEGYHEGTDRFNRSLAINRAARAAGAWSVAIVADADTFVTERQARHAVELALDGGLALAYDEWLSLNRDGTEAVLNGFPPSRAFVRWDKENAVSSCLAVPRALFDEVGGFDCRFEGWGFEDRAFYLACSTLADLAPQRVAGPAWHLWHPRSSEKNPRSGYYKANAALCGRYRDAAYDRGRMREVLAR
jgi:hypothetical protein